MTIETAFVIVLILFGVALFGNYLNSTKSGGAFNNGIEPCPPHKWKYDDAGMMVCDKCAKPPLTD